MRNLFACLALAGLTAACSAVRPDTVASPQLDSGVTASSGGGTQTLNNTPNLGVTTRVR